MCDMNTPVLIVTAIHVYYSIFSNQLIDSFIHFDPVGHSLRYHEGLVQTEAKIDVNEEYRKAVKRGVGAHETWRFVGSIYQNCRVTCRKWCQRK